MTALLTIENNHQGPAPVIDTTGHYIGVFHNAHGEQAILLIDAKAGAGQFMHGDAEWEPHPVSKDQIFPEMILGLGEKLWVLACWAEALHMTNDEVARHMLKL